MNQCNVYFSNVFKLTPFPPNLTVNIVISYESKEDRNKSLVNPTQINDFINTLT